MRLRDASNVLSTSRDGGRAALSWAVAGEGGRSRRAAGAAPASPPPQVASQPRPACTKPAAPCPRAAAALERALTVLQVPSAANVAGVIADVPNYVAKVPELLGSVVGFLVDPINSVRGGCWLGLVFCCAAWRPARAGGVQRGSCRGGWGALLAQPSPVAMSLTHGRCLFSPPPPRPLR